MKIKVKLAMAMLLCMISTSQAENDIIAEAYVYGNSIGAVTIDDLKIKGHAILLKGVQVWPLLTFEKQHDMPEVNQESANRHILAISALEEITRLRQMNTPHIEICNKIAAIYESNSLTDSVRCAPQNDCILIYWNDDPAPEYFTIRFPLECRATAVERLEQELGILKKYIINDYSIIVTTSLRQMIPPNQRSKLHNEISEVLNGKWRGGILNEKSVNQFRNPEKISVLREE